MANKYISDSKRRAVIQRANRRCEYCLASMDNALHTFHIEHIIPFLISQDNSLENLALACGGCNGFKSIRVHAIDPLTQEQAALFHPRKDKWLEHFIWTEDYLQMLGITPTGRVF